MRRESKEETESEGKKKPLDVLITLQTEKHFLRLSSHEAKLARVESPLYGQIIFSLAKEAETVGFPGEETGTNKILVEFLAPLNPKMSVWQFLEER